MLASCWASPIFWWRDDDAVEATAALDRLLDLSNALQVPVALAVIPAGAQPSLPARLRHEPRVSVLQHGWDHVNHASPRLPESEFPASRDPSAVQAQLERGKSRLTRLFGDRFLPVLVPPHNRLAPPLTGVVANLFEFVSVYGDFPAVLMASKNIQVDIIDWRTQNAKRVEAIVRTLVTALRFRRYGVLPATVPIGILSHHLWHGPAVWESLETILTNLCGHPVVTFRDGREVFR